MNTSDNFWMARLAGAAYLVLFVTGSFPIMLQASLLVRGDAAATVANFLASETLFRLGIISEIVMAIAWLSVAFLLHLLLKHVHKPLATLFLVIAAVGVAVICANIVFQAGALVLMERNGTLQALDNSQTETLAVFFLTLYSRGWTVAGVYTGLWMLPLGYVAYVSGYFPRIFGILLMTGCFAYLFPVVTVFLFPEHVSWNIPVMSIAGLAEISFGLWLFAKGAKPNNAAEPGFA